MEQNWDINVEQPEDSMEKQMEDRMRNFAEYLRWNHKSENTIRAYLGAVGQFHDQYLYMTENTLHLYKLFLVEHYKPQTVNLRIRAMNAYLEFMGNTEIRLSMVRIQQKLYLENVISEADYEYMKKCLARDGEWLYYFLIRYMAATGMRVSEVTEVMVRDVDAGYKDIYSKDNKVRRIYVPLALKQDTLRWLKREERYKGYVFLNRNHQVITSAGIRGQLKKFAGIYGISEQVVYPHSFRHRFAKNFIEKCGDISMLSDLLGHESIETTRIYLRRSSTEQQQIVNQVVDW